MKRVILFLLLVSFFHAAHAQIIRGTILDKSDSSKISFAVIYISGTSIGTYSDINGNFELNISKNTSKPITISMVGFYSFTISEPVSNKDYLIYLSIKTNELNEVVVKGKRGRWETYLHIFKGQFLGTSANALMCDILNERDIRFFNITDTSLSAYSLKPLIIQNKALGYDITYYLDKFNYNYQKDEKHVFNEKCLILGNYYFKDNLLTLNESERMAVERRRRNAYLGSRMHFFRLLYYGHIHHRGKTVNALSDSVTISTIFLIYTRPDSKLVVIKKDSLSGYLKYYGEFSVKYKAMSSRINVKMDSVYFEKHGYYDPMGVNFSGSMSDRRIGDLLPYEYRYK
jgi:hypothetical protein